MPTVVTLSGFKEFGDKLKNMPRTLEREIGGEVKDAAELWAAGAKRDAPVDVGFLRGQISTSKLSAMDWEVTSHAEYSAYMEWGTKTRVSVPADLQGYANQFRGGANQGGAKKAIFKWMDRVGIPKDRQWVVFMSIIIKGVHPRPFFFTQRPLVQKQLFSSVSNILNKEH